MKKLILLLIIILPSIGFGQNLSSLISDKEIIDFIEWELSTNDKNRKVFYKIEEWTDKNFTQPKNISDEDLEYSKRYLFITINNLDTIFSEEDINYLINQTKSINHNQWENNFTNNKISKKRKNRIIYSLPLFSIDKKHVIIYKELWKGKENARGCYYLYEKTKFQWKLINTYNCWMS